jgi:hypothetical protein
MAGVLREKLSSSAPIAEKCKAIQNYFSVRKAESREAFVDFLDLFPLILSSIFGTDSNEGQESWLDFAARDTSGDVG